MSKEIKRYVADRDKALENLDIHEYIQFLEKWESTIGKDMVSRFKQANEIVQMATMCKMVCCINKFFGTKTWLKAHDWLDAHNMFAGIQ